MKSKKFYFLCYAFVALFLIGCSKQEQIDHQQNKYALENVQIGLKFSVWRKSFSGYNVKMISQNQNGIITWKFDYMPLWSKQSRIIIVKNDTIIAIDTILNEN